MKSFMLKTHRGAYLHLHNPPDAITIIILYDDFYKSLFKRFMNFYLRRFLLFLKEHSKLTIEFLEKNSEQKFNLLAF